MNQKTITMAIGEMILLAATAMSMTITENAFAAKYDINQAITGISSVRDEAQNAEGEREAFDIAKERVDVAAAPMTNYKIWVTLTNVPAGADDLIVNATIDRSGALSQETTVTSPSEGDVVKFSFKVPPSSTHSAIIGGTQANSPEINSCDVIPLPTKGGGPIRVDFSYPL
jgi:hypothetical protein